MPQSEGIRVRLHLLYGRPDIKRQGRHYSPRIAASLHHDDTPTRSMWTAVSTDA